MAFPAAPTESGSAKIHFLTTDGNAAAGWVAIETGTTGTGSNTVGWAGVATHVEGDEVADPGDITTGAAPVVLVAGDDGTNAVPLQLSGSDLKITLDSELVVLGAAATTAIGKLGANSGVDIGDVDVTSVVPGTTATSLGKAEDAAHISADTGVMALAVRRDANTTLVDTTGDYAPLQVDADGKLKVEMFDGGDTLTVASHAVTNAGTFAVQSTLQAGTAEFGKLAAGVATIGEVTIGTATTDATDLAKAEDVAHGSGDVGVQMLAVRKATPADLSGTDGDYEPLQLDNGRLWTSSEVEGDVAHDAVDSGGGGPVKIGGIASSSEPAAVAAADRVNAYFDRIGRQVIVDGHANPDGPATGTITLNATPVTVIAAPAGGTAIFVTGIQASNGDSAIQRLDIKDGAGGTVLKSMWLAADGGGYTANFRPFMKLTAATLCEADISADITANDVRVNIDYYVAPDP